MNALLAWSWSILLYKYIDIHVGDRLKCHDTTKILGLVSLQTIESYWCQVKHLNLNFPPPPQYDEGTNAKYQVMLSSIFNQGTTMRILVTDLCKNLTPGDKTLLDRCWNLWSNLLVVNEKGFCWCQFHSQEFLTVMFTMGNVVLTFRQLHLGVFLMQQKHIILNFEEMCKNIHEW